MYIYKTKDSYQDYSDLFNRWLSREPQFYWNGHNVTSHDSDWEWFDSLPLEEQNSIEFEIWEAKQADRCYQRNYRKWMKSQPHIEYAKKPCGDLFVDVLRGYCPVKLLFHEKFTKKFPWVPISQIIQSNRNRHRNWGPYDHKLKINIYDTCDIAGMKTLEVDLWQDMDVEKEVLQAAEEVRTPKLQVKIYHL